MPAFPNARPAALASSSLAALRTEARAAVQHAHAPFSGEGAAAALLLSDGTWVPGVRVESASFSLTLPPALNAFTTAVAAGRRDVVAAGCSHPMQPVERAFLEGVLGLSHRAGPDACAVDDAAWPALGDRLNPFLEETPPEDAADGVALARSVAERALVPHSRFPVGAVLAVNGALVPGVNVEPASETAADEAPDWSHVLCAERCALGTACSYGLLGAAARPDESSEAALYLSCPKDAKGSPCGACRQLLVELLPHGVLWMDRGADAPEQARPADLLPGSFRGAALTRRAPSA